MSTGISNPVEFVSVLLAEDLNSEIEKQCL